MADFDLEQLKTVLDKALDHLSLTKGDSATHGELEQIKNILQTLHKTIADEARGTAAENKEWIKEYFDEWDRRNPLKNLSKAVDDLSKKSDNPLRQGGGGNNRDNTKGDKDVKGDDNPLRNPAQAAKQGSKLAKALGSATEIMAALAAGGGEVLNFIKNNAQAYRQVLGSAEGSISSIMEMRDTAAKNNMTVDQMIDAAQNHAGVRQAGLKEFASFQSSVRQFAKANGDFGMSVAQLQDVTASYMDMSKSLGVLNSENQGDAVKGIGKLVTINQDMAAMMGKTAEEARQAALEQARDPQFNAAMRAANISAENMKQIDSVIGNLPDATRGMVKELYSGHGTPLTKEVGQAVAESPANQWLAQQMAGARDKGMALTGDDMQKIMREYAARTQAEMKSANAKNLQDLGALQMARGDGSFNMLLNAQNEMAQVDPNKIGIIKQDGTASSDDATKAALKFDEIQSRFAAGLDDILNSAIRPAFQRFGGQMNKAADMALDATQKLHNAASWLDKHPNTAMAGGGILGGLALAGEVGATLMAGKMIGKLFKGGRSMLKSGSGAGTATEAAEGVEGAEVAGAGAEGAGLLGMMGPAALAVGGGLGVYSGYNNLATGKKDWWTRLKGYGEAGMGGAAIGGAAGLAGAGIGAVPGALLGGLIGLGTAAYSDWSHPAGVNTPTNNITASKPTANASGPQNGGTIMDLVHLDQKMIEMQHKIHFTLLDIKKASYDQLNAMHEELAQHKSATDRIARLLEESNRNTKQIGALT